MRILTSLTDEFSLTLNNLQGSISDATLKAFKPVMQGRETNMIKMQLGPIEVEKLNTFYIEDIQNYCKDLQSLLKDWHTENISMAPLAGTTLGATKRLSTTFSTEVDSMKISYTFNIHYSSKNYYELDSNITSLQEELAKIEGEINSIKIDTEKRIWSTIKEDLKKRGVPVDDENYITQASRDENYLSELLSDFMDLSDKYESLLNQKDPKIEELSKRKEQIANELEKFVVEANVTEPVLLDELAISTRKNGLFVYLDIRDARTHDDLPRNDISEKVIPNIISKFKEMEHALNELCKTFA